MRVKLGADGFPKRGLSRKKQLAWIEANRPVPTPRFWESEFYLSQSSAFLSGSIRWLLVAVCSLGVAALAQVAVLILRAVGS